MWNESRWLCQLLNDGAFLENGLCAKDTFTQFSYLESFDLVERSRKMHIWFLFYKFKIFKLEYEHTDCETAGFFWLRRVSVLGVTHRGDYLKSETYNLKASPTHKLVFPVGVFFELMLQKNRVIYFCHPSHLLASPTILPKILLSVIHPTQHPTRIIFYNIRYLSSRQLSS
jgi:hypothetical protein